MQKNRSHIIIFEITFYIIYLITLVIKGIPFFYFCNEIILSNIGNSPKSFFSYQVLLQILSYFLLLISPFLSIYFISKRLYKFPELLISAICNGIIALIYFYIYVYYIIHSSWFRPDIFDVIILNPFSNLINHISNNPSILTLFRFTGGLFIYAAFFSIVHLLPLAFFYNSYKKNKQQKFFKVTISIFSTFVISHLLIDQTFEFSNNLLSNGIVISCKESYLTYLLIIIALIATTIGYFSYLAPLISLIIFMPFLNDEQIENKAKLIGLNLCYLLFIFCFNIGLGQTTEIHFYKIPKAFPGEILKSNDELEKQNDYNDIEEDFR